MWLIIDVIMMYKEPCGVEGCIKWFTSDFIYLVLEITVRMEAPSVSSLKQNYRHSGDQ